MDALGIYDVRATNQLESTFMALVDYELFVSEKIYDEYYRQIIKTKRPNLDLQ